MSRTEKQSTVQVKKRKVKSNITDNYNFRGQIEKENLRKQMTGHIWGYLTCDPDWPAFCS